MLAEGHYALAVLKTWHDWDLQGAEPEWKRTVEINPNNAEARAFYSHYLNIMQRPDEAMAQITRAMELDPFGSLIQSLYAADLLFVQRYDEAIFAARKALGMQPGAPLASAILLNSYRGKGMRKEALEAAKVYYALMYSPPAANEALDQAGIEADYAGAMRRAAAALAVRFQEA